MSDQGFTIEHGWDDDEIASEPASVEWLKVVPGMEKTLIVVLSDVQQIIKYWGHWWQPIREYRRCSIPGDMPDMSCPLCREKFARQKRFVAGVWCDGRVWRWEFSEPQRRYIVAGMRETGADRLRGLPLALVQARPGAALMIDALPPGQIDVPETLPEPCDVDLLMSQQWARQALKYGKRSAWTDTEAAHAKRQASPPGSASTSRQVPGEARQSTPERSEATPSAFALDYHAKYGRWPKEIGPG